MPDLIAKVNELYAAFGRGDVQSMLANMTEDISWEFEAPAEISWGGIRRGPREAVGFFAGIAAEHADPKLEMAEYLSSVDSVAVFGRYQATVRKTGVRVDVPVGHLFKFHGDKVSRYVNLTNTAAWVQANSMAASAR